MKSVAFTLIILCLEAECVKILGVFPAPGYSQFILAEALMKELAKRGHDVTVISPYSPTNEMLNYRTIKADDILSHMGAIDFFGWEKNNVFTNIKEAYKFGNLLTELTLKNADVQNLLRSNEHFDLVIVEQIYNEAMKGFATHFGAPLVLFSAMGLTEWNNNLMGNPALPSMNAVCWTNYTNKMTFFQRVKNVAATIFDYLYRNWFASQVQRELLKKYFPKPMDFDKVINNASLMLLNSHLTTSENVLLPYNMIEIGGFHIVRRPLTKDIEEYLDSAKDGIIYFSMGTYLKSSDLSNDTLNAIFTVFEKLKQKILWKFEKDLPDKPANVFISKWFKQSDILAHPNVKLFITHGGLLSITEALYHGVPMIGVPVFVDQKMNMARASHVGVAKVIPFTKLSQETLSSAIEDILNDAKFKDNSKQMSHLIKDRPLEPLELAMYWIEYVIRHKGKRFEISSMRMYWFQVYMFDIFAFVLFNVILLYVFITSIIRLCRITDNMSKKKHQ